MISEVGRKVNTLLGDKVCRPLSIPPFEHDSISPLVDSADIYLMRKDLDWLMVIKSYHSKERLQEVRVLSLTDNNPYTFFDTFDIDPDEEVMARVLDRMVDRIASIVCGNYSPATDEDILPF